MRKSLFTLLITLLGTISHCAEKVYMDKQGVIRWTENRKEVALFGANYCLPSACDFRAADYVGGDRKQMFILQQISLTIRILIVYPKAET